MTLPEAELSFYFAAAAQLEPALRPAFTERVVTILQSHADPGPGDVNRVVRQALIGLWVPPDETELRPPRWHRVTPARSGPTNGSDSRRRLVVHRPPGLFPPTGGAVAAAAPPQVGGVQACRVNRPWQTRLVLLSPLRVFLPIND